MRKFTFFVTAITGVFFTGLVFAAEGGATGQDFYWACALGSGLIMGLASGLGALGQGRAAAAALEGLARNPQASDKIFTPMILGLVFMESLVLFGFAMAFLLQNKVPGLE